MILEPCGRTMNGRGSPGSRFRSDASSPETFLGYDNEDGENENA